MFFRSPKALVVAVILLIVGFFLLVKGQYYREISARERTTPGTIIYIHHGKGGPFYGYTFKLNGVTIQDESDGCRTALTPSGCAMRAPVLVYYDPGDLSESLLEEFGEAGRGKLFFGTWMAGCGLLLIGLHFAFKKLLKSPDESDDSDVDEPVNEPEVIHVTPQN